MFYDPAPRVGTGVQCAPVSSRSFLRVIDILRLGGSGLCRPNFRAHTAPGPLRRPCMQRIRDLAVLTGAALQLLCTVAAAGARHGAHVEGD